MEDTLPRSATQFLEALKKRRPVLALAGGVTAAAALLPAAVMADDSTATQAAGVAADTAWVIVTGCLVMFVQAGFAMLEVGFSRMTIVGTVVAEVVTNLSVSSIAYWAVGFGIAFGAGGWFALIGGSGFFPTFSPGSQLHLPAIDWSTAPASAKWFFEFVFCAVSLAIVWGTMIERTKFIVYILFGIPFAAFIYPLISHPLFADIVVVTNLAAAAGAVAALATIYTITKTMDVGMIGNGAIAALVAITAPSGYVEPWAAIVIGAVAGVIVVVGVLAIDKYLD